MFTTTQPIVITPGEPAGIGPDIVLQCIDQHPHWPLIAVADKDLLQARAQQLALQVPLHDYHAGFDTSKPGLAVIPCQLVKPVRCGQLEVANARYVLDCLQLATAACLRGEFRGLVTGPVHKGVINDSGVHFTGHTEYLSQLTNTDQVVMLLAGPQCKVALATTHCALHRVPQLITHDRLYRVIKVLMLALTQHFTVSSPRILVCGLNPHAGENGHLGREELEVIIPTLAQLRREHGYQLIGPVAADTAFTPNSLAGIDVVLAMYHDQGLGPFKTLNFHQAVNLTLGLPFLRASVDHGTALSLAGTGTASNSSLQAACEVLLKDYHFC